MAEFEEALQRFQALVTERLERLPGAALRNMVRYFLDAEPVWSGDLVMNFVFTQGSPSGMLLPTGTRARGPRDHRAIISSALDHYYQTIPDLLPPGVYYFTNVMEYSLKIEQDGSPRGWGQGVIAMAASAWPQHVKLGLQEAIREARA